MVSLELLNIQEQIDSNVSPVGETQANQLGDAIVRDKFVEKMGIQLVAHSPLKRARQTSFGMLGCVTLIIMLVRTTIHQRRGKRNQRSIESSNFKERTPMEWLPLNHDAFAERMLGLLKKIKNCDVWSLQFDNSI